MKPEGAIIFRCVVNFGEPAFREAVRMLFQHYSGFFRSDVYLSLRMSAANDILTACRIARDIKECGWELGIHIDQDFEEDEWTLSGNNLTIWSPGA